MGLTLEHATRLRTTRRPDTTGAPDGVHSIDARAGVVSNAARPNDGGAFKRDKGARRVSNPLRVALAAAKVEKEL